VKNKSNYLMSKTLVIKTMATAKVFDAKKITAKWMLASFLTVGTLLMATKLLAAEDNPYQKNYKAQNAGGLVSMQASPDTKILVSNHKDEDNISMLENGFDMMGSSGFDAGNVLPELALQHAKAIKADTVLVYKKYGSAKTPVSRMQLIKEAAKKGGGEVDAKDIENAEDTPKYKYYASYWAKLPAPLLGVHIIKLAMRDEETEKVIEKKGLKVLAVIKDSPAAKSGLMRGDILYKLAETELNKPEELSPLVRKFQGQNVAIEYEREGVMNITKAQIDSRN
jgi:membrane-associated protease RseP (regulator of RpoE activity)